MFIIIQCMVLVAWFASPLLANVPWYIIWSPTLFWVIVALIQLVIGVSLYLMGANIKINDFKFK